MATMQVMGMSAAEVTTALLALLCLGLTTGVGFGMARAVAAGASFGVTTAVGVAMAGSAAAAGGSVDVAFLAFAPRLFLPRTPGGFDPMMVGCACRESSLQFPVSQPGPTRRD